MNSFMPLVTWVLARLKEPSTYAGLAGLLVAAHLCGDCSTWADAVKYVGIGLASAAAVLLPEGK